MITCRLLISLSLLAPLTACSLLPPLHSNSPPPHQSMATSAYEQRIISEAEAAVHKNQWTTAFKLYQQALNTFPESLVLKQAHNALQQRQTAQLAKLEQERLIARGEWLLKDLAISQLTDNASSEGWFAAHPAAQKHQQANELAAQLAQLGQQALHQDDLDLAARTLPLAWKLAPTAQNKALQEQLRLTIKAHSQQPAVATSDLALTPQPDTPSVPAPSIMPVIEQPEVPQPDTDKSASHAAAMELSHEPNPDKRLLTDFKRALKNGHFTEARQLLEKLQKQGIDKNTIANLHKQLNDNVAGEVKSLMAAGVSDYSQQHYEAALKAWQQAQALAPDNTQLAAHIERVGKILEKLQGLRNKQLRDTRKTDKMAEESGNLGSHKTQP